jgi:arylformamidase
VEALVIIDLSVPINEQTPVYPGDPATKIAQAGVLAKDGYTDHYLSIGTHVGTHIDAPMHMLEGGKSLDQMPIDQFVGKGRVIDVGDGDFDVIKSAGIQAGEIVLLRTGMSEKYHEPVYFENYPAMTDDIAKYLVERKVKMVGIDTCSVDNQDGFPIHKTLLAGNVLIIENLTNLDQLIGKDFTIYALPIKLQLDGAPTRVVAEIKQ